MRVMSRYNEHNMRGGDFRPGWCAVCGRAYPEAHHVVPRSLGGSAGPTIHLCGHGNNLYDADGRLLHHGAVENHRLWFWWNDGTDLDIAPEIPRLMISGWSYLLTDEPVDEMTALGMSGWRIL